MIRVHSSCLGQSVRRSHCSIERTQPLVRKSDIEHAELLPKPKSEAKGGLKLVDKFRIFAWTYASGGTAYT